MSEGFRVTALGASTLQSEGGATLDVVTLNTVGTGAIVTLYDSPTASGAVLAVVTPTAPISLVYNIELQHGLTVDVATAACDITIGLG